MARGDFDQGDFVQGDLVRGDFDRGDFVRGDFVLSPSHTSHHFSLLIGYHISMQYYYISQGVHCKLLFSQITCNLSKCM